ncbi:glycosyltransferase family 4 protein [Carboxylicivirga sp. A043]|uniref:glycosyltransferase family 4 protein n=1 Tax=Carboxylicivirga litoralis TaxID=2816963 RepID=UPI0021CAFA8B|nr:glycosyltransferase family 4 protein [Carboxylicivirga sp. A043]MCU4156648.1 glycosyltransferase family 4 protein [Carboxylicivirga sp. A043]
MAEIRTATLKILQINKTDAGGGAAVAANRLNRALRRFGVESKLLVQDLSHNEEGVYAVDKGFVYRQKAFARFAWERLTFLPYERNASVRYAFSPANTGIDITEHPLVKEADIIHLHWINQGFLSIETLGKLLKCGKPIVWTQHDMWSFTGGCHYAGTCLEFLEFCSYCPFLRKSGKKDLSARIFAQKRKIYNESPLSIVTCSKWLRTLSQESKLLRRKEFYNIPNPIDTDFYQPRCKQETRKRLGLPEDKRLILFGAANVNDPRKGMRYFIEALSILAENFPVVKDKTELVVFGKMNAETAKLFPFKTNSFKFVSDPDVLVDLYSAADNYVLPSLQDNLPNTVMESLACGTPVVGFSIGGVPEMITHKESGYLAEVKNSLSLATGIYETLFVSDLEQLSANARQKAVEHYSEEVVANQYKAVYKSLLK